MPTSLPPVVFIKTHKVGGTSLRLALERLAANHKANILSPYGAGAGKSLAPFRRQRIDQVLGVDYDPEKAFAEFDPPYQFSCSHLAYDKRFFDHMVPGAKFLTMVRDPFERAVSHYYYHGGDDFELWFNKHHADPDLRFAADNVRVNNYFCWWLGFGSSYQVSKAELEERFMLIGLQECFTESVAILKNMLDLHNGDLLYSFERSTRRKHEPVPERTKSLFIELNQRDYRLYALAKELFEENLQRFEPTIGQDIEYLQRNVLPPLA